MSESSVFDRVGINIRQSCRYYTGYPKELGPSRVIYFTSERQFVQLLHQGYPIVVAFTIRENYTKHPDKVLEEAAAEFYPHVKFMRVECPKYPRFYIEIFRAPQQAATQGRVADPNVTKYSVKVLPDLEPSQYFVTVTGCNNDCDITCCYCVHDQPPVCVQCCNDDP